MSNQQLNIDYFQNHLRGRKFPWSLYHSPIERDLQRFLKNISQSKPDSKVLVIGCGMLHERDQMASSLQLTVADIDQRAIDLVLGYKDTRVVEGICLPSDGKLTSITGLYDAIYAKEVIEHIVHWQEYLKKLGSLLTPNGQLWLSTPNYGEPWLSLLERTVLEWIAQRDGFSRKDLHPSKLSKKKLHTGLCEAGFQSVQVRILPHRLALIGQAIRKA